jgi:outer membrane lipoprotein SlyB
MKLSGSTPGRLAVAAAAVLATACVSLPTGPSMMALPGTGRSFDSFRYDDSECRQFAYVQVGGVSSQQAANQAAVGSAIVGTALGAAAGAALGGRDGAAVGAGMGLLAGSAYGSSAAWGSSYATQRQYDNAYIQCMYAKGHRVPVPAGMAQRPLQSQQAGIPPPPPGTPPPPPPDAPSGAPGPLPQPPGTR